MSGRGCRRGRGALLEAIITVALLWFLAGNVSALQPVQSEGSAQELISRVGNRQTVVTAPHTLSPRQTELIKPRIPKPVTVKSSALPAQGHVPQLKKPAADLRQATVSAPRPPAFVAPSPARITASARSERAGSSSAVAGVLAAAAAPPVPRVDPGKTRGPGVKAKALFCLDCGSNTVMLAQNTSEPLPIASITKLLTAMVVLDGMNLKAVLEAPADIEKVERHRVGIRSGDRLTVEDLLHGMLIESGNDCAEVLARNYPRTGEDGFIAAMNRLAVKIGATQTRIYTPSGLDLMIALGRKQGRNLLGRKANVATAEDVALIARHAFQYPLIREISSMKTYSMRTQNAVPRTYQLVSNDKLLGRLPVAGAKTGFTNMAGRCIVALFKGEKTEHVVVVLNAAKHFKAAEKIYRWACKGI